MVSIVSQSPTTTSPYYAFPQATPTSNTSANTTNNVNMSGAYGPNSSLGPTVNSSLLANNATGQNISANEALGQSALYTQQQNQQQQQDAQANAAAGLTSSPWGASTAANQMTNFNNTWQNNQLARSESALSSAEGATAPLMNQYNQSYGNSNSGNSSGPIQTSSTTGSSILPYPSSSGSPTISSVPNSSTIQPTVSSPYNTNLQPVQYNGSTGININQPIDPSQVSYGSPASTGYNTPTDITQSYAGSNNYAAPADVGSGYTAYSGDYGATNNYDPSAGIPSTISTDDSAASYLANWPDPSSDYSGD
jgi:hypothetical protein